MPKTVTPYTRHYEDLLNFTVDNAIPIYIVLGIVFTLWVVSREKKR